MDSKMDLKKFITDEIEEFTICKAVFDKKKCLFCQRQ